MYHCAQMKSYVKGILQHFNRRSRIMLHLPRSKALPMEDPLRSPQRYVYLWSYLVKPFFNERLLLWHVPQKTTLVTP